MAILIYSQYSNTKTVLSLSKELTDNISSVIITETLNHLEPAERIAKIGSEVVGNKVVCSEKNILAEQYLVSLIKTLPGHSMIYFGDKNGTFIEAFKSENGLHKTKVIRRDGAKVTEINNYRNAHGEIVKSVEIKDSVYDPRERPWYTGAVKAKSVHWSDVYIFHHGEQPGITVSAPIFNNSGEIEGVFGVDIELKFLSQFLQKVKGNKPGGVYIVNKNNDLIGLSEPSSIIIKDKGKFRPAKIGEVDKDWLNSSYLEYKKSGLKKLSYEYNSEDYLARFTDFPDSFGKKWALGIVIPQDYILSEVKKVNFFTIVVTLIILVISIIIVTIISNQISKPIIQITKESKLIERLDFDHDFKVKSSILEIQDLIEAIATMKVGLSDFKKYVPENLVRQLIEKKEGAKVGGVEKNVSILFSDIANFTSITEKHSPEELIPYLTEYFDKLSNIITGNLGTIDKYIGDSIMAFWNAPLDDSKHPYNACKSALQCKKKIDAMSVFPFGIKSMITMPTRFGIHTGHAIVGNVGSSDRMNYTVLGDSVNLASRLEGLNKKYGTTVLVSEDVYKETFELFIYRPIDVVRVKGKTAAVKIFELMDYKDANSNLSNLAELFGEAFELYLNQQWSDALKLLKKTDKIYPNDSVTKIFTDRGC